MTCVHQVDRLPARGRPRRVAPAQPDPHHGQRARVPSPWYSESPVSTTEEQGTRLALTIEGARPAAGRPVRMADDGGSAGPAGRRRRRPPAATGQRQAQGRDGGTGVHAGVSAVMAAERVSRRHDERRRRRRRRRWRPGRPRMVGGVAVPGQEDAVDGQRGVRGPPAEDAHDGEGPDERAGAGRPARSSGMQRHR